MQLPKKEHKYHAIKTVVDGIEFPSKREAKRYFELKTLERAGEIHTLKRQVAWPFYVNDKKMFIYVCDFAYMKPGEKLPTIEDVKGVRTPVYRLKKKLIEALYGITIHET